jgi:hypothetical protein
MGWQEELRQLDVDLANGTIDHERHRKLRDELLAGASGGSSPSPVASPLRRPGGQQQVWQSTNPGLTEQQPIERQSQSPAQQAAPTQPAPVSPPPPPKPVRPFETDRRTTAPSPADERPTDFLPYPKPAQSRIDAATVVRPAVLPPPPPLRPEPVFIARVPEPMRPLGDLGSYEPPKDRQKPVWLFVTLGVVLVAALIAVGMWMLTSGNNGTVTAAPPSSSSAPSSGPPTSAAKAVNIPPLPELPGKRNPNSSTLSVANGQQGGLYSAQVADMFTRNGATDIAFNASSDGSRDYLVLVVPTGGPDAAKTVVDYLYSSTIQSGFTQLKSDQRAATGTDGKTRWNTTWYISGDMVVATTLSQPAASDKSVLKTRLDETVKSLRTVLPVK